MYPTNPSLTSSDDGRYEIRKEYCNMVDRKEVSSNDGVYELCKEHSQTEERK